MTDNPMDKLATLGRLLGEKVEEIGLELRGFIPMPDLSGEGPHAVQAVFFIKQEEEVPTPTMPEREVVPDLDPDIESILAGIASATEEASEDAEMEALKQKLLKNRNSDDGGFL